MITCRGLRPELVEGRTRGFDRRRPELVEGRRPELVEGLSPHRAGS